MIRARLCSCGPAGLAAFDFGFLALVAPRIAHDLGADAAYAWLFGAGSFAYAAFVMPAATIAVRLGASRAVALGLMLCAVAAGGLALAEAFATAVAARALLGAGGALAATAALALLAERGVGFTGLGAAGAAGFALGVLAAGTPYWRLSLVVFSILAALGAVVAASVPARPAPSRCVPRGAPLLSIATVIAAVGLTGSDRAWALVVAGVLAAAGLGRAASWLPAPRLRLARVCVAGAATTASGVGSTVLLGTALAADHLPGALLAIFGVGVLPGAWLAARCEAAAAAGLAAQALALLLAGAALAVGAGGLCLAAAIALFGTGHVAANAGVAEALADLAGRHAESAAALLLAAQYVGAGAGALAITAFGFDSGVVAGVVLAAIVALVGAALIADGPQGRDRQVGGTTRVGPGGGGL